MRTVSKQSIDLAEGNAPIRIRPPQEKDGKAICSLVKEAGVLDMNSEYLYLLLGAHFNETCAVAVINGQLAGFVSAYIPPNSGTDVLFVWQVGVHEQHRKRGLALTMLKDILRRPSCASVKYVHTTISFSNTASRKLFTALARELDTSFHEQSMFPAEYFSGDHEEEPLFIIGPLFQNNNHKENKL